MKKYFTLFASLLLIVSIINVSPNLASAATKNMLIVLDASGSMSEMFGSVSRIDAAKSSISDLLASLDPSIMVGFRPYAHIKKDVKADACKVTELLQPFTTDHNAISSAVSNIDAVGSYTPTAYTLAQLKNDFTVGNDNVVILLTDGKETCGGDPAKAAADLLAAGIKVKTYVIGLGLDAESRTQLNSVATNGGGKYFDATDATSLANSFKAIQASERPIDKTNTDSLLGTSVTGGNGYDTAVSITPGMYHLSHHQLPSRYDYFKMDVKAGDVISYSIRSSDQAVIYDPATDSFKLGTNHSGDYSEIALYSNLRTRIDYLYAMGSSELKNGSYTVTADTAGTMYILVGNNARSNDYTQAMSKESLFIIKVTSLAPSNSPDAVPPAVTGTSYGIPSSNTPSQDPTTLNSGVDTRGNVSAGDISGGIKNTFFVILAIIVGSAIFLIALVAFIIYIAVKNSKKKNTAAPVYTNTNAVQNPQTVQPAVDTTIQKPIDNTITPPPSPVN